MTFLNFILLGGTVAAALPIIIHLLNRQRYQTVQWGAMHLLETVLKVHTRRLKWEHLILLIVRTAIPLFIAICMARPVLTGMTQLHGNAPTSQIVLLDNSLSMEGGDADKSNFAISRELTAKIAGELPRSSEIAVVGMAGPFSELTEPSSDPAGAAQKVRAFNGGFGMARPAAALETAAGLFATRMHHSDRSLAIISDFQKVSWSAEDAAARVRAMDLLRAQPVPPRVILFHNGTEIKENVAVENIELSRSIIGINQKIQIRANIKNYGAKAWPDMRVYFRVDGVEKSASTANLTPNGSAQVLFSYSFEKAGSHVVEVRVDADALKADNFAQASVPVLDQLPVLLVSGDMNPEPLRSETAFLEIALQPFTATPAAKEMGLADLISSRVVGEDQFVATDLSRAKVAVLANVRRLTDPQLKAIEDFVRDGGGLLVFPGDRADVAWYNEKIGKPDSSGLLPCKLGALKSAGSGDASSLNPSEPPPAGIVVQHYDHPALALFNNPKNGSLRGAQIRTWYRLDPLAANVSAAPMIAAKLDTSDPFLVEKPYGEGRVILCATACDADWGNLPMRPFYLPLTQQLVSHLASKVYPPRNVEIGQRIGAFVPPAMAGKHATLTTPDNVRHDILIAKKEMHGVVDYEGTMRPGLYLLELPGGETLHFVVHPPPAESNPEQLAEPELQALAKSLDATLVTTWDEYDKTEHQRRFGREIWKGLLWFTLGLIFTELALIRFVTRRT